MIAFEDKCPKSGLDRKLVYKGFQDDMVNRVFTVNYDIEYYKDGVFLGLNILNKNTVLVFDNSYQIDTVSAYEYYKGGLNDFSFLSNKGFNTLDSYILYIIMKAYLTQKFD
jgi:hypothetical protein